LLGCADLRLAPVLAQVQRDRGFSSIVVRSDDGIDELSTHTTSQVWDVTTDDVRHIVFDPTVLGLVPATIDQLRGGEAQFNAEVVVGVMQGRTDGNFAAIRDIVVLNAAAALVAFDAVGPDHRYGLPQESFTRRIARALPVAYQSIDTGSALSTLTVLMSVSQRFAMSAL
jgi:anthranilate phosphoribosyltransferase